MLSERRKRDTDSEGSDGHLPRFPLCRSRRAKLTIRAKKESEITTIAKPIKLLTASIEISTRLTKTELTIGLVVGKIYEGRHWRSPVYGSTDWLTREEMSHANRRIAPRTAPLDPVTFAPPRCVARFLRRSGDVLVYDAHVQGLHPDHLRQNSFRRSSPTRCTSCNVHACSIPSARPTRTATQILGYHQTTHQDKRKMVYFGCTTLVFNPAKGAI